MTKQQAHALAAEAMAYLGRCTPTGIEELTLLHGGTIQILRWWRQGFVEPLPKMEEQFRKLIRNILTLSANHSKVRPSSDQPSLCWMETPL